MDAARAREPAGSRAAAFIHLVSGIAALAAATSLNVLGWILLLNGFRLGLWVMLFAGGLSAVLLWA